MPTSPPPTAGLRKVPQQARSRARVDAIVAALLELVLESEQPSTLTTTDVATRAGVPIGSLYEFFEDLPAIVDAAVARNLARHDELLAELAASPPRSMRQLVDAIFDTYLQLYREDPGFLALRRSALFQPHHRTWLVDRVGAFVRAIAAHGTSLGVFARRPDSIARLDFVFSIGDLVLQAALDVGPDDGTDEMILTEGRAILHYAMRRVMNGVEDDA